MNKFDGFMSFHEKLIMGKIDVEPNEISSNIFNLVETAPENLQQGLKGLYGTLSYVEYKWEEIRLMEMLGQEPPKNNQGKTITSPIDILDIPKIKSELFQEVQYAFDFLKELDYF